MATSIEDFIAYWAARGTTLVDDADTNAALVRGTDYITYNYVNRFRPGCDINSPIVDLAIYEAALIEYEDPGAFSSVFTPNQQNTLIAVDVIKWTAADVDSSISGVAAATATSTKIEAMLRPCMAYSFGVFIV